MGAVAGLLAGVGLLLIWMACTSDPPQWRSRRSRILADILVQAGAGRTSPTMFVLGSVGLGLLVGLVFLGMSRAWPVALSFASIFTGRPLPHHLLASAQPPHPTARGVARGRRYPRLRSPRGHEPAGGADQPR